MDLQLYRVMTRDLLVGQSSFLRRSIALDLSYRSAQKQAPTKQYYTAPKYGHTYQKMYFFGAYGADIAPSELVFARIDS